MKFFGFNFAGKEKSDGVITLESKYKDYENIELITYDQLSQIKVGESIHIIDTDPDAIKSTRIGSDEDKLLTFRVEMKKGYSWNAHMHDCDEVIIMYKGQCTDTVNGTIVRRGVHNFIPKYTPHNFHCDTDTAVFYVEFKESK